MYIVQTIDIFFPLIRNRPPHFVLFYFAFYFFFSFSLFFSSLYIPRLFIHVCLVKKKSLFNVGSEVTRYCYIRIVLLEAIKSAFKQQILNANQLNNYLPPPEEQFNWKRCPLSNPLRNSKKFKNKKKNYRKYPKHFKHRK